MGKRAAPPGVPDSASFLPSGQLGKDLGDFYPKYPLARGDIVLLKKLTLRAEVVDPTCLSKQIDNLQPGAGKAFLLAAKLSTQ